MVALLRDFKCWLGFHNGNWWYRSQQERTCNDCSARQWKFVGDDYWTDC